MRPVLLTLPVLLVASPALSQTLPEGLYDCWISSMNLGQIEMVGGQYRGPALDAAFEDPPQPFTTDGPTITWGGTLGGISAAGTIVSTVVKGHDDGTVSGFDITIQNSDSGNFQTITCYAPG